MWARLALVLSWNSQRYTLQKEIIDLKMKTILDATIGAIQSDNIDANSRMNFFIFEDSCGDLSVCTYAVVLCASNKTHRIKTMSCIFFKPWISGHISLRLLKIAPTLFTLKSIVAKSVFVCCEKSHSQMPFFYAFGFYQFAAIINTWL